VACDAQLKLSNQVLRERVRAALADYHVGSVDLARARDNALEEFEELVVLDASLERDVDRVEPALAFSALLQAAGAREEVLAELVEAEGEHTVRAVKGFLDAVAVMHVDVDVEDADEVSEQAEDADNDVVDVAEAVGLALLGVVQSTASVDCNVSAARDQ